MKEITEALDAWTNAEYSAVTRKLFGYCELMRKTADGSEQPMPVTINGRKQVSLDDRYNLITWMRVPGTVQLGNNIQGNDWAFGLDYGITNSVALRWIIAHKVSLGEDFIVDFVKSIPTELTVSGYQIVAIDRNATSVDFDHESIYTTELGNTVYEKHRFPWNLYAISLNVEFIKCD